FLASLPRDLRAALEVRNPSWYVDDVYELLRTAGVALVHAEGEKAPSPVESLGTTAPFAYARLRKREGYTADEVREWAARFRPMLEAGTDVYVYFRHADTGATALAAGPPRRGSMLLLAAFRINQAIAAAALVPNGLGLLREAIPSGRRGAEFGIVSAATAVGATVGPLVGGFLAAVDWRWIFIVNVPLCAAGLALSWRVLPQRGARETARFDLVGAVGLGLVLLAAAWVLVSLGRAVDPVTVAIGVAVLPAAVALLRYESRHPDPARPPSPLRIRAF